VNSLRVWNAAMERCRAASYADIVEIRFQLVVRRTINGLTPREEVQMKAYTLYLERIQRYERRRQANGTSN